jgi:predicted transposase YbfD/YdcC
MMCRKTITDKIIKKKCDYVPALKNNQPAMYKDVREIFDCERRKPFFTYETVDKGHGRIERRVYTIDTDVDRFSEKKRWKGLKAFGKCESFITITSKNTERNDT